MSIEQARETIAKLAEQEGERQFAREVRAGAWDHRSDVQACLNGTFRPRALRG
jgi:hypothetical protein